MRSKFILLFLLPIAVSAAPYSPEKSFCKTDLIVNQLKSYGAASSICEHYLPAKTKTKTITVAPKAHYKTKDVKFHGTVTRTVTETKVATKTVTSSSTSTITCLNSAYTATIPTATVAKRHYDVGQPKIPNDWDSSKIALACSCLSIHSPTVTVTKFKTLGVFEYNNRPHYATKTVTKTKRYTATVTVRVESTTLSSNGLLYRKYEHKFNANIGNKLTSSFFKNKEPDWTGTLRTLTFASPNWPSGSTMLSLPDGRPGFLSDQSAILFNGFFIAKHTGTYTFSSSKDLIDNWGYLWVGQTAYRNWNDGNTAYKASRTVEGNYGGSYSVKMNIGDAIPLTWLWANGLGQAQSDFTITTPSGTSTKDGAGYFIKACSEDIFE